MRLIAGFELVLAAFWILLGMPASAVWVARLLKARRMQQEVQAREIHRVYGWPPESPARRI